MGRRGHDHMVVGCTITLAMSAITTDVESRSGPGVQHYVMKFVIDLQQVCVFLWVLKMVLTVKI